MVAYYHSVKVVPDKCKGCTICMRRCPTEAIRIQNGRSRIMNERCIDCGECIRVCPHHAKIAQTDPFSSIAMFPYKIALPAPSLFSQFKNLTSMDRALSSLRALGFDDVFEVARAADIVSVAVAERLRARSDVRPLISSACPAIIRLIQVRFPDLIEHIVDVRAPMEVAASYAKQTFCEKTGARPEEVGAFFITPCAAKMTAIRNPVGHKTSAVDGAISILDIYGMLAGQIKQPASFDETRLATVFGAGWASAGGETKSVGCDNALQVDGVYNVIHALEEIENGKLNKLDFFEGAACEGGCIGGPLTFENVYVAKTRMHRLLKELPLTQPADVVDPEILRQPWMYFDDEIVPNTVMKLDENILTAMRLMEEMRAIEERLPGLDCGSCGSPSCRTLAEDIARGAANELNCIFLLKRKVQHLAQEMVDLSQNTRM